MKAQTIDIWVAILLLMVIPILVWPIFTSPQPSEATVPVVVELKVLEVNCTRTGISARLAVISNGNVDGTFVLSGKPYDYAEINAEGYKLSGYVPLMFRLDVKSGMRVINIKINATEAIAIYSYVNGARGNVAKMISCSSRINS